MAPKNTLKSPFLNAHRCQGFSYILMWGSKPQARGHSSLLRLHRIQESMPLLPERKCIATVSMMLAGLSMRPVYSTSGHCICSSQTEVDFLWVCYCSYVCYCICGSKFYLGSNEHITCWILVMIISSMSTMLFKLAMQYGTTPALLSESFHSVPPSPHGLPFCHYFHSCPTSTCLYVPLCAQHIWIMQSISLSMSHSMLCFSCLTLHY